jgi:Arc/MetJ family transcription regulator
MGRTNIEIDDELVEKAMRFTGARTKREVVDIALRRLVQKASLYRKIRRLRGKLEWDGDIDAWRSERRTHTS